MNRKFRHRLEQFLIVCILFALVLSSFSSVFTVKADDPPVVYVVVGVDTEFWGDHYLYLGLVDPHPTMDVREYARDPPMNIAAIMDSAFRSSHTDSYGNSFKMTWLADMDYLEAQSIFVWADGSSAGIVS